MKTDTGLSIQIKFRLQLLLPKWERTKCCLPILLPDLVLVTKIQKDLQILTCNINGIV